MESRLFSLGSLPLDLKAKLSGKLSRSGGWGSIDFNGTTSRHVVASLARRIGESRGGKSLLLTADRRLLARLSESCDVLLVGCGDMSGYWSQALFEECFGFEPRLYALYLALAGDSGFEIPGVCSAEDAKSALKAYSTFVSYFELLVVRKIGLSDCPDLLLPWLRHAKIWHGSVWVDSEIPMRGIMERLHLEESS